MATKAQIEANRKNGQKSSGPVTDAGKARVRQNALRHGLCSCVPIMHDESGEEVEGLLAILREEHEPVDATEEILVYKMAEHFFFAKRASYLLAEHFDSYDHGDENAREISLLMRYHATADRGYYKALNELRKLQKERRLQEIGFVPQDAKPEVPLEVKAPADPPATKPQTPPQSPVDMPIPSPTAVNPPNQPPVDLPDAA